MRIRVFTIQLGLAAVLASARLFAQIPAPSPAVEKTEANVARVTAALLQQQHFLHHPFDKEMDNKFMDRYLDELDHYHLYFLQSDLDEFASYRTNLNLLLLKGDNSAGRVIFNRFMERAEQRVNYVTNLIATEKFDFSGNDRYTPDRHSMPAPKDMAEAKELWRQELRAEYLQEKLSAPDIKFSGPASVDAQGNATIKLTIDSARPTKFDVLPTKFYDQSGHELASLKVENATNAVVTVTKDREESLKKLEKKFYSDTGVELGKIVVRTQTNGVDESNNETTPSTNDSTNSKTSGQIVGVVQLNKKNMAGVTKTLVNRYTRQLKNYKELDEDNVFELYLTALARAYDPHSDYMGQDQLKNFAIMMKLSLFGIGAILQSEDGYCKISELTPSGPAAKSGKLKPGDRIVAVAQQGKEPVDVVGMKLTKVVEQIRGPKGTEVRLTILPSGSDSAARKVITLTRDEIKLEEQEAKAKLYEVPDDNGKILRLGVIDLSSFYGDPDQSGPSRKSPTTDLRRLLARLKKEHVDGIILDLRRNGGGYLEEAINLTGLFITKGPVVQTKEPSGEIVTDSDPDPAVVYDGPMIVLTSRFSASASEILAGALQDYGRALIVGDKSTFGKGTVQSMQGLTPFLDQKNLDYSFDPGALKLTIRKFYRAGGSSTQLKGVVSDIELPSVLNYADVGEGSMPNALEWDEVPSADPLKLNRVKPFLGELQQRSASRLASDKEFSYVNEDIEEYKKALADKSISLNEAERVAEKKKIEVRIEARKKERLSRPKPNEKEYEITLKNVDVAQLQPPVVKTNDLASARAEMAEFGDELPTTDKASDADTKAPDATLEETKRILKDYINLLGKTSPAMLAKDPTRPTQTVNKGAATGGTVVP